MTQMWAILYPDDRYVIRYTSGLENTPADEGHADECEGAQVFALQSEPRYFHGEKISQGDGSLIFDLEIVRDSLLADIKKAAADRIDKIVPLWRQLNDMREPSPEATARFALIDEIRAWSQELEDRIEQCDSVEDVEALRADIAEE